MRSQPLPMAGSQMSERLVNILCSREFSDADEAKTAWALDGQESAEAARKGDVRQDAFARRRW